MNCAATLLDARIAAGDGERTALLAPGMRWSYGELLAAVNRIAHVLVEDLGLVPGNRVLLRSPNTPLLAACWLAVQRGWNLTGDAYRIDEDGWFWYQARTDDLIVSAGNKIAAPEVESVLLEHPEVKECGVVGVADEERGQIVKAFVVLEPGAEPGEEMARELQDFVKARIAPFKYPRQIEFVASLPRTETGKLQRFRLREGGRGAPGFRCAGILRANSPDPTVKRGVRGGLKNRGAGRSRGSAEQRADRMASAFAPSRAWT